MELAYIKKQAENKIVKHYSVTIKYKITNEIVTK